MRQDLKPTGRLHIVMRDPRTDAIVEDRWVPNLVTTAGRNLLSDLLTGAAQGIANIQLAIGGPADPNDPTDPPAPAPGDTALDNELRRVDTELGASAASSDDPPRSVTPISAVLEAEVGGEALVLREAGLIMTRLATGEGGSEIDILYNRVVFPTITKQPELQMTLTWEVIF